MIIQANLRVPPANDYFPWLLNLFSKWQDPWYCHGPQTLFCQKERPVTEGWIFLVHFCHVKYIFPFKIKTWWPFGNARYATHTCDCPQQENILESRVPLFFWGGDDLLLIIYLGVFKFSVSITCTGLLCDFLHFFLRS